MPAGKERLSEIMLYSMSHGEKDTIEHYGLSEETWSRYKREYRKKTGDGVDTVLQLRERFTEEELQSILSSGSSDKAVRRVSYSFASDEIKILVISDTHFGSKFTNPNRLYAAFEEADKKGCSFLLHAGDVTEGMPNRPGSIYEMDCIGYKAQRDRSVDVLSKWRKKAYITGGNHDAFYNTKMGAGMDIVEDICQRLPDAEYIPDGKGVITLEPSGVTIGFWHGADAGASYALSYRPQKIINSLKPHQKNNIMCFGHDHKQFYIHYRNIHALGCGCIQAQTDWMASTGKDAMDGFHIVTVGLGNKEVKYFEPRFYPFYQ